MADDNVGLGIVATDAIQTLEEVMKAIASTRREFEKFNATKPNDEFNRVMRDADKFSGEAEKAIQQLNSKIKEFNDFNKRTGDLNLAKDFKQVKKLSAEIDKLTDKIWNIAQAGIDKPLFSGLDRLPVSSAILDRDQTEHELLEGARKREEALAKEIEQIRKWQNNREKLYNQALRENERWREQMEKERRAWLKQEEAAHKINEKMEADGVKNQEVATKKLIADMKKRMSGAEAARRKVEKEDQKALNERVKKARELQRLGQVQSREDQKLINTIKAKIRAQKALTDEERKFAIALNLVNDKVRLNNGILAKNQGAVESLKLEVSRARNLTLLYSFAVSSIIEPFRTVTDAMIQYEGATLGATRVGDKFGFSAKSIHAAIDDLTQDGLLKVTDASKGLRNLLSAGIGLPDAIRLMNTFRDSAAFNRQGSLQFGEAIVGATEGVKNMNSRMVDNAGISKNLSIIIKEYAASLGKATAGLTEVEKQQAVINGLVKEGSVFAGDADRAVDSLSGKFATMEVAGERAMRKIGEALEDNVALFSTFAKVLTEVGDIFSSGDLSFQSGKNRRYLESLGASPERIFAFNLQNSLGASQGASLANIGNGEIGGIDKFTLFSLLTGADSNEERRQRRAAHFRRRDRFSGPISETVGAFNAASGLFAPQLGPGYFGGFASQDAAVQGRSTIAQLSRLEGRFRSEMLESTKNATSTEELALAANIYKRFSVAIRDLKNQIKDAVPSIKSFNELFIIDPNAEQTILSDKQDKFLDRIRKRLERFAVKGNEDRFDKQLASNATTIKHIIEEINKKGKELKLPASTMEDLVKWAERLNVEADNVVRSQRLKAIETSFTNITESIFGRGKTLDQFGERRRSLFAFAYKTTNDIDELAKTKGADPERIAQLRTTLHKKMESEMSKITREEEDKRTSDRNKGIIEAARKRKSMLDREAREQASRIAAENAERQRILGLSRTGRITLAQERFNGVVDDLNKSNLSGTEYLKAVRDAKVAKDLEVLNIKFEETNKLTQGLAVNAGQIGGAFQTASEMGIHSFNRLGRRIDRVTSSLTTATTAALQFGQANTLLKAGGAANTLAGAGAALGAVGLAAAAGITLYGAITGDKNESEKEKERERSRRFGSTVSRGPQTININPTLAVQADGDVFFNADSEVVVRDRLIGLVQQSIDDGEIDFGVIRN